MKLKFLFLPLILLLALAGCTRTTPPGPNSAMGQWQDYAYMLLRWDNGRTLMFWTPAGSSALCEGNGSTDDPTHTTICTVDTGSTTYAWELTTTDGETITLTLPDSAITISADTLFLLDVENGRYTLTQSPRSFTGVAIEDQNSILNYAQTDPDIHAFITP